jgi:hypothetical protein
MHTALLDVVFLWRFVCSVVTLTDQRVKWLLLRFLIFFCHVIRCPALDLHVRDTPSYKGPGNEVRYELEIVAQPHSLIICWTV